MASQINTRSLWIFLIAGIGLIFAFNAGSFVADENYGPVAYAIGGLIGIFVFFTLGPNANLVIPICYGLTGQISLLPLPFSVQQLAEILACGVFISGIIFKSSSKKAETEPIDMIAWLNIAWLGTVFIRNPVGINALGTSLVGGKPYVDFLLSVMTYIILSRQIISPKQAKLIVSASVAISIVVALGSTLVFIIPSLGKILGPFYSAFSSWGVQEGQEVDVGSTRLIALQGSGMNLIIYCICMVNPMSMLSPKNWRFMGIYLIGILMVFLSGFRSAILSIILITGLGAFLRERIEGIAKLSFAVFFIITCFISISFSGFQLPWTFQRSLSFLPGDWDPTAVQAAKESSDWRKEMWITVMTSDRYIRNKLLGDGYGFLRSDYEDMIAAAQGGGRLSGSEGDKEAHMLQGTYHSGPISSIKRVGYLGLVILLVYMIAMARYAWRLIGATAGTPYQLIALFFGIPMIVLPGFFVFVFGDYNDILTMMFSLGMLKMISASVKAYQREVRILPA
jgi:hypothetical protein